MPIVLVKSGSNARPFRYGVIAMAYPTPSVQLKHSMAPTQRPLFLIATESETGHWFRSYSLRRRCPMRTSNREPDRAQERAQELDRAIHHCERLIDRHRADLAQRESNGKDT